MRDESKSDSGYTCAICSTKVLSLAAGATAAPIKETAHRYRPFCSARCQSIDLGNWLDERYIVPGPPVPTDGGDAAPEEKE